MTEKNDNLEEIENDEEPQIRDTMADDYKNPLFNVYDSGPGKTLPSDLQPAALACQSNLTNRKTCGLYLKQIPKGVTQEGVHNLCAKYGQVVTVKLYEYRHALVIFATTEDAANCLREINGSSIGIRADFKKEKNEESTDNQVALFSDPIPEAIRVTINSEHTAPMNMDAFEIKSLLPLEEEADKENGENDPFLEFYNQIENNQLLTPELQRNEITSGRANYRRSTEIETKMKTQESRGILNKIKQEFVYNGMDMFGETGECKHCGNPTLTFCKGCKDFFCSVYCCNEYKKKNLCCSCLSPTTIKINAKLPSQNRQAAIGRGGKIIVTRSVPLSASADKLNESVSSTSSEVDLKSSTKGRKRLQILQQSRADVQTALSRMTMNEAPKRCQLPSNNKLVVITSVVDHRTLYLRSMEAKDNERYLKFLNDVAECSKTAMTLQEMPKKGDIVLAEFEGVYYRALVARITEHFVVVAFLEFGNLEKKSLSQLKELHETLQLAERFTFKARLSGVVADLKTDQCLVHLYKLIEGCVALKFVQKSTDFSTKGVLCELTVFSTNDSVNKTINRLNNINSVEKTVVEAVDLLTTLHGEHFTVNVLDNSSITQGYITVARCEHMDLIARMQKRIAEFCKEPYEGPHTPSERHVCLGKCGDDWYRTVMVQSFANGNPEVMFLDYGNKNLVNIYNMRRMPIEFEYPCYGVYVKVADFPTKPTEAELEKLKVLFTPGNVLHVIKVEGDDDQIIYIK